MKLKIPMTASPMPEIIWAKGDDDIVENDHVSVVTTKISTSLVIREVGREDSGKYVVTATNMAGKKSSSVKVTVVGKPGPVYGHVHVTDISAESAVISWTSPKEDGGTVDYFICVFN